VVHGIDVQVVFPAGMFKFPCVVVLKLFGIFWNEEEFVEQAIKARHPLSLDSAVPQQLLDALKFTVSNDEATIARATVNFFCKVDQACNTTGSRGGGTQIPNASGCGPCCKGQTHIAFW
jgi:hypothetical protein